MDVYVNLNKIKLAFPDVDWRSDIYIPPSELIRDPETHQNDDLIDAAIMCDKNCIKYISHVPKKSRRFIEAIQKNPRAILDLLANGVRLKSAYVGVAICADPELLVEVQTYNYCPGRYKLREFVNRMPSRLTLINADMQESVLNSQYGTSDGMIIRYANPAILTTRTCIIAVNKCHKAIRFVPLELRTDDFYLGILENNPMYWYRINPTSRNIKKALNACPFLVEKLNVKLNSKKDKQSFVLAGAITVALAYEDYRIGGYCMFTEDDLKKIIAKQPPILLFVDERYDDAFRKRIYAHALGLDINNILYIRDPSEDDLKTAVSKNWELLDLAPQFYRLAITQDKRAYNLMIQKSLSDEDILYTLKLYPDLIRFMTNASDAIKLDLIRKDGLNLKWINKQTHEICEAAILNNPEALQFVKIQTTALCRLATNLKPATLKYARMQSIEMCQKVIAMDSSQMVHVNASIFNELILMQRYDS